MARVLLEQDADGYQRACKELPKVFCNTFLPRIVCYLKQFVVGVLVDTEELLWLYAPEKATSKTGKPYALFNFEAVSVLNAEEAAQAKAFGKQFMEIVNAANLMPDLAEAS